MIDGFKSTIFHLSVDSFPVMEAPPIVTGPEKQDNNSFGFQCEVIYNHDDPDPIFEVVWTFNGQSDPLISPQLLIGHQRTATLDVSLLTHQIDTNVCIQELSSFYVANFLDFIDKMLTIFAFYYFVPTPSIIVPAILLFHSPPPHLFPLILTFHLIFYL